MLPSFALHAVRRRRQYRRHGRWDCISKTNFGIFAAVTRSGGGFSTVFNFSALASPAANDKPCPNEPPE